MSADNPFKKLAKAPPTPVRKESVKEELIQNIRFKGLVAQIIEMFTAVLGFTMGHSDTSDPPTSAHKKMN